MAQAGNAMLFPKAGDYYQANTPIHIGDTSIDTDAELPIFHFGQQPIGFKDVDAKENRNIAVIGCGHAYNIFSGPALKQRGTTCYIIDTSEKADIEARLKRKLDPTREIKVSSIDEAQDLIRAKGGKLDYAAILTPPEHHAGEIRKLQAAGIPTMVEKPMMPMGSFFSGPGHLDDKLAHSAKAPLYAMDWEVALATPLMAALDMKPPFEGIVEFGNGGADKAAFKQFDLNNVTNIETTFVEGGTNPLAGKQNRGGWLWDIKKGGGGLYDMGVHALNALAAIGFVPDKDKIDAVALGKPNFEGKQGIYEAIGSNSVDEDHGNRPTAEMYARVNMHSTHNGHSIPTLLECGKGGCENDMRISMTDANGLTLNWEYGPDKSVVSLMDKSGGGEQLLATAQSHIDPYALMYEEATRFFEREKLAKAQDPANYKPTALYYTEHKAVLQALDAIQAAGRAKPVELNATIRQLQLDNGQSTATSAGYSAIVSPPRNPTQPDGTAFGKAVAND